MTVSRAAKDFRDCAIFIAAHCVLAAVLASVGPNDLESLPRVLLAWGGFIESVIPNMRALSQLFDFSASAWLTLVVMWTLMPLSVWWAIRGDWIFHPNMEMLRRKPSILIFLILLFIGMAIALAVVVPTADDVGAAYAFHDRVLHGAQRSPRAFGFFIGLMQSAIAICIGVLPKLIRVRRELSSTKSL